jgi:putative transposase
MSDHQHVLKNMCCQSPRNLLFISMILCAENIFFAATYYKECSAEHSLYLAAVLDVYSRKVIGWAMENHLRTELVLEALQNAISQRRPQGVIHHSDRGCQYTSYAFGKRCQEAGVMPSMGSVGDCYDNALAESFWATLEREVLSRRRFKTQAEAKMAIFSWIEGWYNPHRRHSSLGYRSPMNYERHALEHRAA